MTLALRVVIHPSVVPKTSQRGGGARYAEKAMFNPNGFQGPMLGKENSNLAGCFHHLKHLRARVRTVSSPPECEWFYKPECELFYKRARRDYY